MNTNTTTEPETSNETPITASPRRLAANRCNAQKSTGPRTARGKARASRNARKHALLAQTVVVRGCQLQESRPAFSKSCREFYTQFTPVGAMEEMLVDQIASIAWRLRRVRRAESGEIELSVDTGGRQGRNGNSLSSQMAEDLTLGSVGSVTRLKRSRMGCSYLLDCFYKVRESVEQDGQLTETAVETFDKALLGAAYGLVGKMNQFRTWLEENPEELDSQTLHTRHKEEVLKFLNRETARLSRLLNEHEDREEIQEQSRQSAALLPSPDVLNKIMRYEASLNRQLYQALNHLERLQHNRQGARA